MAPNPAPDQNSSQTGSHNFGWLGLLGLAELAGLMRRDRRADTTTTVRDDRIR